MLVVSEEKSFMLMASTAVEKDAWLQAIRLCMRDLSTNVEAREKICGGQVCVCATLLVSLGAKYKIRPV